MSRTAPFIAVGVAAVAGALNAIGRTTTAGVVTNEFDTG